jgi:ADP-ribosylglycohydrolase
MYTPNGEVFDVGRTCLELVEIFMNGIEPTKCGLSDENSNGNGSLMRILPVAIYSYINNLSDDELLNLVNDVSSLTMDII